MKKIAVVFMLVLVMAFVTCSTASAAYQGISGSCKGTTRFNVKTRLGGGWITFKPKNCGTVTYPAKRNGIYYCGPISMGQWPTYRIVVKQGGRVYQTHVSCFGGSIRINLGSNSTYNISVVPDPAPGGSRWTKTSFWELSSGFNISWITIA